MVKRMKNAIAALGGSSIIALASGASAQTFGEQGRFAVSAERLSGFLFSNVDVDFDEVFVGDFDTQTTAFSFLGTADTISPFANPRVGFDYFLIDGLSLGGVLFFWTRSTDVDPGGEVNDTLFLIGPRVGYAFMFTDTVGIWPRGGFTFFTGQSETDFPDEANFSGFGFSVEAPFVFAPVENTAIYVGPSFDIAPIGGGETDPGSFDFDLAVFDFGLYAGLGVWF